jgi:hypothetical protein
MDREHSNTLGSGAASRSHLVAQRDRSGRTAPQRLSAECLRIVIGRHVCMDLVMPIALEQLRDNYSAGGANDSAEILIAVLGAGRAFWGEHPGWREEVALLVRRAAPLLPCNQSLRQACEQFAREQSPPVPESDVRVETGGRGSPWMITHDPLHIVLDLEHPAEKTRTAEPQQGELPLNLE